MSQEKPRILVIDNYDSFVYNLVQYLGQLGVAVDVCRNDDPALSDASITEISFVYSGLLLSPGPGTPERAGAAMDLVREARKSRTPLLGVCLGHQAIGAVFGGTVDRAPELLHGKTSLVYHNGRGLLRGLPEPFIATRYHSLTIIPETIPEELEVIARTKNGIVMAIAHRDLPIQGLQFHPESVLTQGGYRILANWLESCGLYVDSTLVHRLEQQLTETVDLSIRDPLS